MAATKRRDRRFPQADFELALTDALAALLDQSEITPGAQWHFQVSGETLTITRIGAPEDTPQTPRSR